MNKKALKAEIIKCGRDPVYFIKKYVKIEHPVRGLIDFSLFDYQEELLSKYINHRFNIINKARQLGISETTAAYALWLMIFRKNKNIVVMATKKDVAKNIIRKVKTGFENLPDWLLLTSPVTDNVYSIEFSNGSRIKAIPKAKDAGRSEAGSLLIIDEAAHIEGFDEIWTGIKPVVSAGGSVIMLSSPNGTSNVFYRLCQSAMKNIGEFIYTELMWWLHPEHVVNSEGIYDLEDCPNRLGKKTSEWFRKEIAGLTEREINQEYECNFNASGDTVLDPHDIKWYKDNTVYPPIKIEYADRNFYIWNEPMEDKKYVVFADVARGDGTDNSGCHIIDIATLSQVAEYQGKLDTEDYASLLVKYGKRYNNAIIFVENNSIGLACLGHITNLGYEKVFYTSKKKDVNDKVVDSSTEKPLITEFVPGYTTSEKTRPIIVDKLCEYVKSKKITIRSERTIDEFGDFIWKNGKPQAASGKNDDLVMSLAACCWMVEKFLASSIMTEEMNKTMLDLTTRSVIDQVSIPGATKDPRFVKKNEFISRGSRDAQPTVMHTADGQVIDLGWLISKK